MNNAKPTDGTDCAVEIFDVYPAHREFSLMSGGFCALAGFNVMKIRINRKPFMAWVRTCKHFTIGDAGVDHRESETEGMTERMFAGESFGLLMFCSLLVRQDVGGEHRLRSYWRNYFR